MTRASHIVESTPHPARSAGRGRRGFAILEMMVTISLLSLTVLALSSYSVTMTRQMRDGAEMMRASTLARARFEQLSARRCDLLVNGTTTVATGRITEQYTITRGSRSVTVSNKLTFPSGRALRVTTLQILIPCPALP
jgi:prepilin-type N-terminal cleavage/methylation domain-containing protein